MKDSSYDDVGSGLGMASILRFALAVAAFLGVLVIVLGIVYSIRTFDLIYTTVSTGPEAFGASVQKWTAAVGGDQLDFVIAGVTYHAAPVVALAVLGGGTLVLVWISMRLILTGAKVVSWTLGDREAIKQMIAQASSRGGDKA
jgi:hypothetical protein